MNGETIAMIKALQNKSIENLKTSGGSADAGKVLTVGSDGKITPIDLPVGEGQIALDGSLSVSGAAAGAKETGDAIRSLNGSLDTLFEQEINAEKTGANVIIADAEMRYALLSSTTEQSVAHSNKNILATPYDFPTFTSNGVTYTANADGSISVRGTATGLSVYPIVHNSVRRPIKEGVYTISGCPQNEGETTLDLTIGITGVGERRDFGEGVTVNVANDTTYYLNFYVKSGQTVDLTVYPQIEPGETTSAWVEHKGSFVDSTAEETGITLYDGVNVFTAENEFAIKYITKKASESPNVINVKDLGAVGDGITDDTEAIKNALLQGTCRTVFLPSGTYLFSETLVIPDGTTLRGCGKSSVLKLATNYVLTSYSWRPSETLEKNRVRKPYIMTPLDSSGCTIENFALEGQTLAFTDDNEDGIAILGSNHIVRNIIIENIDYFPDSFSGRTSISPGEGIYVAFAKNIIVENIRVKSCGYEGIGTESCETVLIQNCTVGKCNQTGIQIHRSSNHIKVIGNTVKYDTSGGGAMTLHAFPDNPMDDIQIIGNYFDGSFVLVGGAENNMRISGNYIWGALSCNNKVYRDRIIITDNVMDGCIILYADDVIIANNAIKVNAGTYMVRLNGNKNVVENNLPMGSVSLVWTVPHDTE